MKKIHIGSDHAGFDLKEKIKEYLKNESMEFKDHGTFSKDSVDYPDYAHSVAKDVEVDGIGILICGSANGVAMAANKHSGVRASICWTKEVAILARSHNNANIICLPARFIEEEAAIEMVNAFIKTEFEGGRHGIRVSKIDCN